MGLDKVVPFRDLNRINPVRFVRRVVESNHFEPASFSNAPERHTVRTDDAPPVSSCEVKFLIADIALSILAFTKRLLNVRAGICLRPS
jgi:hypothetical protein